MDRDKILQKLESAACKAAERASDACDPGADGDAASLAPKFAGAALSLSQAIVTLTGGERRR